MRVLVLDDDDVRHHSFRQWLIGTINVHVHTAREAIAELKLMRFDVVCLDGDLHLVKNERETESGEDVAKFIAHGLALEKRPKFVLIHSHNHPRAERMKRTLDDAVVWAVRTPFGLSMAQVLELALKAASK